MDTERTQQIERLSGILALVLILGGAVVVMLPFLTALLWAVILAVATKPVFDGLRRRLGGRTELSASILTLAFFALVALPVAYIGTKFADEVPAMFANVKVFFEHGLPDPPEVVKRIPFVGPRLDEAWRSLAQDTGRLFQALKPYAGKVGEQVLGLGAAVGGALAQILFSLLILFFLYTGADELGPRLAQSARRLGGERGSQLLVVAEKTMRSVVYGVLGAAAAQGLLATIGMGIAGVPHYLLLGVACGLLALIPLGLVFLILLPAAGWLFYVDSPGWGTFLLAWTFLAVGQVDNFVRPVIISRGANLPLSIILLGTIGGLGVAGILGIFVGPTVLGVAYNLLSAWSEEPPPTEQHELAQAPKPGA
ncbi:MAG TPA: AI-2E family transporter [Burkholderiales bacterium]|nr:AI-2E family transporter [Burkholderiales bacterium]